MDHANDQINGKPLIFYDMTRLFSRRLTNIPTGIDRIDIRFAEACFDEYEDHCFPILKIGQRSYICDQKLSRQFLRNLSCSWFAGKQLNISFAHKLETVGLTENIFGPYYAFLSNIACKPLSERLRQGNCNPYGSGQPLAAAAWVIFLTLPRSTNLLFRIVLLVKKFLVNSIRKSAVNGMAELLGDDTKGIYVNCSHHGLPKLKHGLRPFSQMNNLKTIAYIHDIIPIEFGEYTRPGHKVIFENFLSELNSVNPIYITNSADTAKCLKNYAKKMKWQMKRVDVIHPGIDDRFIPNQHEPVQEAPYFVILGTIEPRKNHLHLLHIWREMAQDGIDSIPHLFIIGKRGWENENILAMLERCEIIQPYVFERNDLDDVALVKLLAGARAVLFPSFAEGFGLPLAEAIKLRVPIIASDLDVFREFAGDMPIYLNPLDGPAWKDAILKLALQVMPENFSSHGVSPEMPKWVDQKNKFIAILKRVF